MNAANPLSNNVVEADPPQNEEHTITKQNSDGIPNLNANVVPEETDKNRKENVVIDIVPITNQDQRLQKDYLIYGYYGDSKRPLPTTWVMYQGGAAFPPSSGTPLDYDPESRNYFLSLVFTIVFIMITVTAAFTAYVIFSENAREFFLKSGIVLAIPAMILMLILNYAMACSACTRMMPCSIICLVLAVIGMSIICAFITVRYETRIIFYAVIATAVVMFVCVFLAFTSFDFTAWMLYIVVIAVAFSAIFMIFMLTMIITGTYMKMVHLALLIISTLISVVVITMELQMILGGRTVELSENDFALAAYLLYTSIVDVFLKMVQIIGIFNDL